MVRDISIDGGKCKCFECAIAYGLYSLRNVWVFRATL